MKFEDIVPEGLIAAAQKMLDEGCEKVDPKKLDPDLDGVPANTVKKEHEGKLPAQPSELKPEEIEAKLKEAKVSGEPSMLEPESKEVANARMKANAVPAEKSLLDPAAAEAKMLGEAAPEGFEQWVVENKARFVEAYGLVEGEAILFATAWAMKNQQIKEASLVVPAEKSHQDPDKAEKMMSEDDEDDESHGKDASGKVPNLDSIARESVEVNEELEKYLDPQTGEIANRAKPPKGAHLVQERSPQSSGLRIQLEWANGKAIVLPPASEPALVAFADVMKYVVERFADRPDWIEAIEKSLLE